MFYALWNARILLKRSAYLGVVIVASKKLWAYSRTFNEEHFYFIFKVTKNQSLWHVILIFLSSCDSKIKIQYIWWPLQYHFSEANLLLAWIMTGPGLRQVHKLTNDFFNISINFCWWTWWNFRNCFSATFFYRNGMNW